MATDSTDAGLDPTSIALARRLLAMVAVLAIMGTVLALVLVQRIGTTYRNGLQLTSDAADVAAANSAVAIQLADDLAQLAKSTSAALDEAEAVLRTSVDSVDDIGVALGTNLATGVEGTANIASGMAGFIETIERFIPGNSQSLAEDLRAIADALEPVPGQLRTLGDDLQLAAEQIDSASTSLAPIARQLDDLAASIDDAQASLAEIDALAQQLSDGADEALERSSLDLWLVRLLVVVLGLGIAALCIALRRALDGGVGAGGGTRTHTPRGTGT